MARIPKWGQELKERIETGQGYQFGNEGKKATWRADYLKDLPTKQYGRSYDDKLKTFVESMGGDEREANRFRTWMNQRESGELEKNINYKERLQETDRQAELIRNKPVVPEVTLRPKEPQRSPLADSSVFKMLVNGLNLNAQSSENVKRASDSQWRKAGFATENSTEGDRFRAQIGNAMFAKIPEELQKSFGNTDTVEQYYSKREFGEGGGTDLLGQALGYGTTGLVGGAALRGLGLGAKSASFGQLAKEGSLIGLGMSGTEVGARELINPDDYTWKQNLGQIALETAGGAVLDPAIHFAGKGISKGIQNLASRRATGDVPTFTGAPSQNVVNQLPTKQAQTPSSTISNDLYDNLMNVNQPRNVLTPKQQAQPQAQPKPRSTKIDDVVRDYGFNEVNPETIAQSYNQKTWHHGTGSANIKAEDLDPFFGTHESLFGNGIYLTDSPDIAQGYAKARSKKTGTPVVYETDVKVDRVLDLEIQPSPEAQKALLDTVRGLDSYGNEVGEPAYFTTLIQRLFQEGKTTEDIIQTLRREIKELSSELEIPSSEFVEDFQNLASNLKMAGYDGVTHTGGARTGNDPHRVLILLDPHDAYSNTGRAGQITRFEPSGQPKQQPQPKKVDPEFQKAVDDQFTYLKDSMKNRKGVTQGGVVRNDMGEVVDRYGRISENPGWYQEFYRVNGRQPTNKDLRELAERHVREGFSDEYGKVPSFEKQQKASQYDSQINKLETLAKADPEQEAALRPVIEALKQEKATAIKPMRQSKPLPKGVKAMQKDTIDLPNRGTQTKKTISRQQVLSNMKKNLGVTIRTGKMGPVDENVKGYFKVDPEVIRSKRHGDLQVISHEIGHHLDKKFKLTSNKFDSELLKLGKVTSGAGYSTDDIREEGLAEFIRHYLTDPQTAQKQAPRFFSHFEGVLPKDVMKGLKKTQNDLDIWITQGPEKRFEGKIDYTTRGITDKISEFYHDFVEKSYSQFVDKFDTLKKVEKEITGKVADASESLYKKARLSVGAPKKGELILQDLKGILKPIEKYGYSMKDVSNYAAARHALELENLKIESGFTREEIDSVLKKFEGSEMEKIQKELVGYNNKLVDMLQESGILSKEAVQAMRKKYPDYVPFYRFFEDDMTAGWGNKGFTNLTNPVKRLKGSTRDIINPVESMIKNTFAVVNAVEKNKVGLELSRLADVEGAGRFIERLDGKAQDNKDSIVTVFEKGEKVRYKLDPELYRSIQMLDEEATNILVKILSAPTNILRAGATLTPEFMIRNPIRDQFQAYVVSNYGYNPIIDLPRGLWHVIRGKQGKSDVYKQWVQEGGGYGNYLSQDRNYLKEQLSRLKKEGSPLNKGVRYVANPKEWLRLLQSLSELSEEATKVGEFRKATKKKGATPQEAAFQSRDLMDFGRSGSITKVANRAVAFLNANVQGKDKLLRTFKQHPVRSTIRSVTGITLPTIGAYLAMEHLGNETQKESWRNTPKWVKDSFFILPIPGTDELARIPKPFDLAPVFSNLAERIMDGMYENDPEGWGEFVKSTGANLAKIPLMLTALTPVLENITNYSFFTGGPIVPQRDQDLMPQDQYGVNTSLVARTIGEQTAEGGALSALPDQSPYKVDNFIRGYGAGLGQYAVSGIDALLKPLRKEDQPTPEKKKWSELPVINAFTVDTTGGGKVMNDFYDTLDKLRKERNSANRNERTFIEENTYKSLTGLSKEISELRKEYREVQASTTLSPESKRSQLDRLDEEMNRLARKGVDQSK